MFLTEEDAEEEELSFLWACRKSAAEMELKIHRKRRKPNFPMPKTFSLVSLFLSPGVPPKPNLCITVCLCRLAMFSYSWKSEEFTFKTTASRCTVLLSKSTFPPLFRSSFNSLRAFSLAAFLNIPSVEGPFMYNIVRRSCRKKIDRDGENVIVSEERSFSRWIFL